MVYKRRILNKIRSGKNKRENFLHRTGFRDVIVKEKEMSGKNGMNETRHRNGVK